MAESTGWVPTRSGAVWAGWHPPESAPSGIAVVLVPPYGWEGMACQRQLRGWARRLAAAGHAVVRYHPPGEGDSEGLAIEQDLDAWAGALQDLIESARAAGGASRVVAVGLGLGGLVALHAVDRGAQVDDLVVWATPGKGRLLLRELRAFASLTIETAAAPSSDEALWVHGYPLGLEAQQQLTALDASTLDLRRLRRALVLGRGTLPADAALVAALSAQGVDADDASGPGYAELTVEPRLAQPPTQVQAQVQAWLLEVTATSSPPSAPWPTIESSEQELVVGPARVIARRPVDASLTVLFIGAGAVPRSGPNRMWTDAARRWADRGVACLRVDLAAIGEGSGPDTWEGGPEVFYDERYRAQLEQILDRAEELGLPTPFVAVGLCSGGYWAVQAGIFDRRVRAVVLLNSNYLVWPPPLTPLGARGRFEHLTSAATWKPLLTDAGARRDVAGRARRSLSQARGRGGEHALPDPLDVRAPRSNDEALGALQARGVRTTLALSPGEPMLHDMLGLPARSAVRVHELHGPGGAHTLGPRLLQLQAIDLLDQAIEAVLSAEAAT